MGKRSRSLVMVGPSSWAALEITSAEPGCPPTKGGSSVNRKTAMTDDEVEAAETTNLLVMEVSRQCLDDGGERGKIDL